MFSLNDNNVLVVPCKDYERDTVANAFDEIFLYFCKDEFRDKKIYLKPNILRGAPKESATTTHPEVIYHLAKYLKEAGAHVLCGDSPNFVTIESMLNNIYSITGIKGAMDELGIQMDTDISSVRVEGGKYLSSFRMLKTIHDSDIVINLPKAKTHAFTGYTGCVKNLFGIIPGPVKGEMHFKYPSDKKFCGAMIDICNTVNAGLHIVDAVIGMEGHGPSSGDPKFLGALVAGKNPYAVDEVVVKMMRLNKDSIPQIDKARDDNLTPPIDQINILGASLESIMSQTTYFKAGVHSRNKWQRLFKTFLPEKIFNIVKSKPYIQDNCVKCGICKEACPPKVITMGEKKAEINYKDCIKCYCCQELCPAKAIKIGKN